MCIQCVDGNDDEHINEVAFEEPQWKSCWDDLTGSELDRGMVEAARAEESQWSRRCRLGARYEGKSGSRPLVAHPLN